MKYVIILNKILNEFGEKYKIIENIGKSNLTILPDTILIDRNIIINPNNDNIFILLHEIGHCETNKETMMDVEKEFLATQWAINESKKYKIKISKSERESWQLYIDSFLTQNNIKYILEWR